MPYSSRFVLCLTWVVGLGFHAGQVRAGVLLDQAFRSSMVLQRDMPAPIFGTARPGEQVTVTFLDQKKTTKADQNGKWLIKLDALKAGGPHELTATAGNTIKLTDVLVGEVWVCSGQSNMGFSLKASENGEKEAAAADYPQLRLSLAPGTWAVCTPQTAAGFSAVSYYFGRDLHKALGVPVGVVHRSIAGSQSRAWVPLSAIEAEPAMKPFVEEIKTKTTVPVGGLYQTYIRPLMPMAMRGVIWYQGEEDWRRPDEYRQLFPTLVRTWRTEWGQGDFPFLFVQLAPIHSPPKSPNDDPGWFLIREAQAAALTLPKTGMAVILDGDASLHPLKKHLAGQRLALAARGVAYGEKLVWSGPVFDSLQTDGKRLVVRFQHAGGGLEFKGGPPAGFAIAGTDGKYAWADAKIDGAAVILTSKDVPRPVAVRYGWGNAPRCNLFNQEGLPAASFRSESVKP